MACDVMTVRLHLPQIRVLEVVEDTPGALVVSVESTFRRLRCAQCGFKCHRVHDRHAKRVRDLEVSGRRMTLVWQRRRMVCGNCGSRFLEDHPAFEGVGAGNSAMVVDLPRCGPILSPCVPNLVPIPGITGSTHCAVRPLQGPRDHRVAPPTRCAAPAGQPTRTHRRRPELARGDSGRARATEPSRVAGHPRHTVALAPAPHRRTLGPTTATAGSTIDLNGASPTHTAPRSGESDVGLPPHPRRTARARPHHRSVNYLADPQQRRH